MRKVLLAIALLGLVGSAAATDPQDNLSNGALIAHHPEPSLYTPDLGYCALYAPVAITACEQQDNRIDGTQMDVWFVLAQWGEAKNLCAAQFGFEGYPPLYYISNAGACIPAGGQLTEFSTSGWPGPNEGTAITAGVPWVGDFIPLYWFEGYAYYDTECFIVPLGDNPATGLAEFANCEVPGVAYPIAYLGAMGFQCEGIYVCAEAVENWVCCFPDGGCQLFPDEGRCVEAGGTWRPDLGQSCDPNPCPPPLEYACCFDDGSCELVRDPQTCDALGGVFHPEWDYCDPNPCPQPHACCYGPNQGQCIVLLSQEECETQYENGMWMDGNTCEPSPCPVPADETSWGSIKAIYR